MGRAGPGGTRLRLSVTAGALRGAWSRLGGRGRKGLPEADFQGSGEKWDAIEGPASGHPRDFLPGGDSFPVLPPALSLQAGDAFVRLGSQAPRSFPPTAFSRDDIIPWLRTHHLPGRSGTQGPVVTRGWEAVTSRSSPGTSSGPGLRRFLTFSESGSVRKRARRFLTQALPESSCLFLGEPGRYERETRFSPIPFKCPAFVKRVMRRAAGAPRRTGDESFPLQRRLPESGGREAGKGKVPNNPALSRHPPWSLSTRELCLVLRLTGNCGIETQREGWAEEEGGPGNSWRRPRRAREGSRVRGLAGARRAPPRGLSERTGPHPWLQEGHRASSTTSHSPSPR
ncbi:uncharacterized protein LOC141553038 [Sminthopsis crassicaudata]|uniref:uncharacterized protein LOC141553038 n=1 Tax=Sminthopsis crassicaudata TaxID=9301 RepID=UPI003D695609